MDSKQTCIGKVYVGIDKMIEHIKAVELMKKGKRSCKNFAKLDGHISFNQLFFWILSKEMAKR